MSYKIEFSPRVHIDIYNFSDYIFRHSFSLETANKVSERIYGAIYSLSFLPHRFEKYIKGYRRFILDGKYKIIYKIEEENKKVIVIRIFRTEFNDSLI